MCVLALSLGCVPAATTDPTPDGGAPGPSLGPLLFQVPQQNASVSEPFTISVSGPGISRVLIFVGQERVHDDIDAPYEYVFDASTEEPGDYFFTIVAQHPAGLEEIYELNVKVVRLRPPLAEILAAINALGPAEWYEIPQTHMREVDWDEDPDALYGDQATIVGAASGGAFDPKRNRLLVWGGGGEAYRNDLYAFDMERVSWTRLTDPSQFPPGLERNVEDKTIHNDGAPVARHSFDFVEYIPDPVDRLYVGGGTIDGRGGVFSDDTTFLFNFETNTWTPGIEIPSTGNGSHAAVDANGILWQQGAGGAPASTFIEFDAIGQTFTPHVVHPGFYAFEAVADIDQSRNLYLALGNSEVRVWDLDNPDDPSVQWATTGDTEIQDTLRPGFVYHAATDRMVAWNGGKDVYVLNPDTKVWTKVAGQGDVDPGAATQRGIHGRWRYVPSLDVFVLVTSVDLNVFVYRLPQNPDSP